MDSKNTYKENSEWSKLERILEEYTICLGDFINITDPNIIKDLKISVPIAINIFDVIIENTEELSQNLNLSQQYQKILKVLWFATLRCFIIENFKSWNEDTIENFIKITQHIQYYSENFKDIDLRDLVILLQSRIKKLEPRLQNFCKYLLENYSYDNYSSSVRKIIFSLKYFQIPSKITLITEWTFYVSQFFHKISDTDNIYPLSANELEVNVQNYKSILLELKTKFPQENFEECDLWIDQLWQICEIKRCIEWLNSTEKNIKLSIEIQPWSFAYQYLIWAKSKLILSSKK